MPPAPAFRQFVAIDWSGAKGTRHKGIAIARAMAGDAAPALVPAPAGGWARAEVADWLLAQTEALLAGFDFSFAPPFLDRGAYLPGLDAPTTAPAFWAWVEAQSTDPDCGIQSFIDGPARAQFWTGAADGAKADFLRWRQCELAFNGNGGGKAATVFDCVGAAQVAKASFAGMRVLARLHAGFAIWPFDAPAARTIVEIYSRAMLRLAGGNGRKLRTTAALNTALATFDSQPCPPAARFNDHQSDALISAAALRALGNRRDCWSPAGLTQKIARTEGWTFGIGLADR